MYSEVVNAVLEIETSKADSKVAREATKKVKIRGSYFSHSDFSGAPSYQGAQHIPPQGVISSKPYPMSAPTFSSQVRSTF